MGSNLRIACISDTHDIYYPIIHGVDAVIHAGDITLSGSPDETMRFLRWFNGLPIKHKLFIGGNHDRFLEQYGAAFLEDYKSIHMLWNSSYDLEGYKVWGSPTSAGYGHIRAFAKDREELWGTDYWSRIPRDADIVVTHGPAFGIRDTVRLHTEHLGDPGLLRHLKVVAPMYHIFGHIHGGRGVEPWGPVAINAAVLTEAYHPYDHDVTVIELPRKVAEETECPQSQKRQDVRDVL